MNKKKVVKISILVVAFFLSVNLKAQISPGALSRAHSKLEGLSNCTKCHVLGDKVENFKCLNCHKEIKKTINEKRGYHSITEVKGKNCFSCHGEHFGRNFDLIHFNKEKFKHAKVGFNLDGKHSHIKCYDCHKKDFIRNSELKSREKTFLGLSKDCSSCHKDYHQGSLGNDCASCHNTTAFRPAPKFEHKNSKFKLTGAHKKVKCQACHKKNIRNGVEFQQFKGIDFKGCFSCHKDLHNGKFGKNCTRCHSTASFKLIGKIKGFNHELTNFPLAGKHRKVACAKCHGNNLASKPAHKFCNNCHKDFHKGAFVKNGRNPDCNKCHDVYGFNQFRFGIEEHNRTKFPLSGSHLAVPCSSCHAKNKSKKRWQFKFNSLQCIECHKNIHKNQMSQKFIGKNNCSQCHISESWDTINFNHALTNFPLEGKHSQIKCKDCHLKIIGNKKIQLFKTLTKECTQCHRDVHMGQFANNGRTSCQNCHNFNNWKPTRFNHNKTRFPLTGAHANLDCFACHKIVKKGNKRFVKFKIEDVSCASCHS